ncbi:MAG TPA: HD domain-containing protein [Soehngenia sp.]|nr:HD domain-containing protein [Soehngenia sp.]HPP31185.1 HD domain-containing protein [Soehngenia sp.]
MNKKEFKRIENYMRKHNSDEAHDIDHIFRVLYLAIEIAKDEEDVDMDVLITASLLHDIGRKAQLKNKNVDHAKKGAAMAKKFLLDNDYSEDFAKKVSNCIKKHSFRSDNPPVTCEEKILFDADKLDVLGAIGIARTVMYQTQTHSNLYNLDEDGNLIYGEDDKNDSFLHEYKYKLERVPEKLFTVKAKEIASKRIKTSQLYYDSLIEELEETFKGKNLLKNLL